MRRELAAGRDAVFAYDLWQEYCIREGSFALSSNQIECIPIFLNPLGSINADSPMADRMAGAENILHLASSALPVPGEDCAWEDILAFKADVRDKRWGFHRFLRTLATAPTTEAEMHDEIEWMVYEYSKAMAVHNLKASHGLVDVFIISPLEILENLVKFNWSQIAKGALSVNKRKVDLLEAEMKAPGRECAYVFDARKRFGPSS